MIDFKETAHKIREFGGKWHVRDRHNDAEKEALMRQKCADLGIAPVLVGELD